MYKLLLLSMFLLLTGCTSKQELPIKEELVTKESSISNKDGLLLLFVEEKIKKINQEVKSKLDINLYIKVEEDNGIILDNKNKQEIIKLIKEQDDLFLSIRDKTKPYALIVLSLKQNYLNLVTSKDLISSKEKDNILNNYMIPILTSKDEAMIRKINASILNGVVELSNTLAKKKNITLESTKSIR